MRTYIKCKNYLKNSGENITYFIFTHTVLRSNQICLTLRRRYHEFCWHVTVLSRSNSAVITYGRTRFWVCVHCAHDLGDMTLIQGHDIPLGHGQKICEILSWYNLAIRSYGPDTDFGYV